MNKLFTLLQIVALANLHPADKGETCLFILSTNVEITAEIIYR